MDYIERMINEKEELGDKINRLDIFITNNEEFENLSSTMQRLMKEQHHAMCIYYMILEERIKQVKPLGIRD